MGRTDEALQDIRGDLKDNRSDHVKLFDEIVKLNILAAAKGAKWGAIVSGIPVSITLLLYWLGKGK